MSNVERYQQNLAVLAQLKNDNCSTDLLKSYTGWGGLKESIYNPEIYRQLIKVLTPDEINSLKKTLKNAYFTPKEMVKFMYAFLEAKGFQGGEILEPSIGNGVFIEHMPNKIRQNSKITAVEIDKVTSNICKKLYSDIKMYNCGFEDFNPDQQRYDLIIGNPPYGAEKVVDSKHVDLKYYRIHHYFVAKSMRLLKQGGILAMVLPAYFMDNVDLHVRHIISREGGEIIAAYRLPDDLFQDAKVTVDIVFLRKGKTSNAVQWTKTRPALISNHEMSLNEYYHQHKNNIMGKLEVTQIQGKNGLTCRRNGVDVFEKLHRIAICQKPTESNDEVKQLKIYVDMLSKEIALLSKNLLNKSEAMGAALQKISKLEKQ